MSEEDSNPVLHLEPSDIWLGLSTCFQNMQILRQELSWLPQKPQL